MIQPAAHQERILPLDVLRGFAVLGILIMNVQALSMPYSAYGNPASYGDFSGINRLVWLFGRLFADQKFMTLFSLLFGAGIYLVTSRIASRGQSPAGPHYRRMAALLVAGLIHAYLIWYGDILVTYALCGMVVYFFSEPAPAHPSSLGCRCPRAARPQLRPPARFLEPASRGCSFRISGLLVPGPRSDPG